MAIAIEQPRSYAGIKMPTTWYAPCKMLGDVLGGLALFVLTAPVLLLAMVLVKLTSPGPALYLQVRVGRKGRPFFIYKIRTMYYQCEKLTGPRWSTDGDGRITPLGRWLRRTHIDELPQLWNVIRGDMSLVGPRPERPEFVPQLDRAIDGYRYRLWLRPGVTGLAQVQLPPDTDLDSVRAKLAYDLHYIRHRSLLLDVRILLATLLKMAGVPFGLIRQCFGFPVRGPIEQEYSQIARGRGPGNGSNLPAALS